ncbi:glycine cleavage system aminomethyltransferase GcvT [Cellulomonas sp.]|uniref:glycine cleavage system aminomethyltransferase GcvT n=1 Tax=Cellulomonas sp. TaxID=40001 RepID=UPI00258CCE28|nr:glycine cleavage system aminomethyltransferase GcvT [Cellulomonas sp.]MCR6688461.1 glycine cleavage system aminomethyltransferase GcvT [Cellulomonas sp.]
MTRLSPLHDEHVALGAALTDFAGWQMPLRYGSDVAEHTAVRTAAGLFDLSHMGELELSGPGAGDALDRALVGNLSALAVGRARYTMICAPDGGVLDDLVVYRLEDERYLVVANASNVAVVRDALTERLAGRPDAVLEDRSEQTALIAVQGPLAEQVVVGLVPDATEAGAVRELRYYAAVRATVQGIDALVARTGYTGEDGFELFVPADDAPALWRAVLAAGAPLGLVPAGLSARDSLRLEAGMPLYGNELDRTTTPHDAGLGRVVRLDKVDRDGMPLPFVGRDALEARAHATPARTLVGLQGLTRRAARHGYDVVTTAGTVVGTVTSGAPSPTLGHPVAMAYVTPEVAADGTDLAVDVRGRHEAVRVVPLPFYRRAR